MPAGERLEAFSENDDPIHIAALEHYAYCPRQYALIHFEQVFADNVHTARGHAAHRRVDEGEWTMAQNATIERSVPLFSKRLNLIGRSDVVEFRSDGTIYPIEYKHGPRRQRRHDDLQLAAQALCLEEMTGRSVPQGAIYHVSSRRRREVVIHERLRLDVEEALAQMTALRDSRQLPEAPADSRCRECSLVNLCQPVMVNSLQKRVSQAFQALFDPNQEE